MKFKHTLTLKSEFEEAEKALEVIDLLESELQISPDLSAKLMLAISEATTNAIVHGNRENPDLSVLVETTADDKAIYISVKDEGGGFTPSSVPDPTDEENLLKTSGRGVFLMNEVADAVQFSENGSKITLTFNR
jgi:serine/threonine-protein kinase RsbW